MLTTAFFYPQTPAAQHFSSKRFQGVFLFNATPSSTSAPSASALSSSRSRSKKKGRRKRTSGPADSDGDDDDDEGEEDEAETVAARGKLFEPCWAALEQDINRLLAEQNQKVFGDLVSFFRSQSDYESPSPFNEVPTAVLLTG